MGKIVAWCIFGIFAVLSTSIAGCTMYSNSVEAEQIKANTEHQRIINEADIGVNEAILQLINKGINPIAARCAIKGFQSTDLCGTVINQQDINLE